MVFLRTTLGPDANPLLRGRSVYLRPPLAGDYEAWSGLRAASEDHLRPFEPAWARDELSRPAFRRRLRHYQREHREDHGISFFIFRSRDNALLGGVTLSNLRRGVTQAVTVGYWIGGPYAGQGYMSASVALATAYAFDDLKLHRVEAACLPHNKASIRVLEKNGFQREGLARRYLRINNDWQDHLLFARLVDDPLPGSEQDVAHDSRPLERT